MKQITLFCLAWSLLISPSFAQIDIGSEAWQADLKFLQNTVHDDYSFLFKKITAKQFDDSVEKLHRAIPDLQEHEIVAGFARIVSSFQYGHTSLDFVSGSVNYHRLPINLYRFDDGIFVEGVHKDHESILGCKLLKVHGMDVDKALEAIRPVVPAENDQFFKAHGLLYLGIPEVLHAQGVTKELSNKVVLTLELDGKVFDEEVEAITAHRFPNRYGFTQNGNGWLTIREKKQTPYYLKNLDRLYYFEYLADQKTVYVRQSQIQDDPTEDIPTFYKRVFEFVDKNDVERLVLDVRLNGGGNNYKNLPVVTGIIRSEKINQPGKLFVIIGRRTYSACQNLVNELDNYTNTIFVGEPTAENINFYGDNRRVVLPNSKIPVFLSFAWWQDKPQWENGPWTTPHIAVGMSFEDYRTNRDPVLEAVLKFRDDDFILDPMAHFTELFKANKLEELEAEARRMVNDPKYAFFDFEGECNKVGYELLGSSQMEQAIFVFEMNTRFFPKSANAWDSLGEANWRAKQYAKSIECYEQAISLDPEGSVGENARSMLRQVKEESQ